MSDETYTSKEVAITSWEFYKNPMKYMSEVDMGNDFLIEEDGEVVAVLLSPQTYDFLSSLGQPKA